MIDNAELNRKLQQLIAEAKSHPFKSQSRQRVLTKLFQEINKLSKFALNDGSSTFFKSIDNDAKQSLFLYICEHLGEYDPERGTVIGWMTMLLQKRFINKEMAKYGNKKYLKIKGEKREFVQRSLTDLNWYISSEPLGATDSNSQGESLMDKLTQCIEKDENGMFEKTHIEKHPEANWKAIALKRINGDSWEDISASLGGISLQTLSSFYHRQKRRWKDYLRKKCQE